MDILRMEAESLRKQTYDELLRFRDAPRTHEVRGGSRTAYQVQILAFWDAGRRGNGNLRVMVAIDDRGWRSLFPLTTDFIIGPDGTFVGE